MTDSGTRAAIRLLQDAAERGEIDPWDVDVIAVIDGFLDQLRSRIDAPRMAATAGGSYEQDLAESSEAFLAASMLVGLKAELLESATFPPEPLPEDELEELKERDPEPGSDLRLPVRPERHLRRRPVAPPPLQRPVTLGELIRQLEDIAERLEREDGRGRQRQRSRNYSDRAAIAQVAALAHREKLPETTAALGLFLQQHWQAELEWLAFEALLSLWQQHLQATGACEELDADRVGVFWALLFLCSQGSVELEQQGGLYGPLQLRRAAAAGDGSQQPPTPDGGGRGAAMLRQRAAEQGSDGTPARSVLAA
ncbi:MAG: segregation/condensation protein A [Synechococcus sp.]|nr:segregation/condensation protein A [Synechococcus sp.]